MASISSMAPTTSSTRSAFPTRPISPQRWAFRQSSIEAQRQELESRHWQERLELSAQHKQEGKSFWAGFTQKALGLLDRVPALRSVIGHLRNNPRLNPERRQELEKQALESRHAREQKIHERKLGSLGKVEAYERRSLLKKLTRRSQMSERQREERQLKMVADFLQAAEEIRKPRDHGRRIEDSDEGKKPKKAKSEKAEKSAKRERKKAKTWKDRREELDAKHSRDPKGPGRGKGGGR